MKETRQNRNEKSKREGDKLGERRKGGKVMIRREGVKSPDFCSQV